MFRVDVADFTLEGYTPLLDASARLRTLADSLADGEAKSYESPTSWGRITFARSTANRRRRPSTFPIFATLSKSFTSA